MSMYDGVILLVGVAAMEPDAAEVGAAGTAAFFFFDALLAGAAEGERPFLLLLVRPPSFLCWEFVGLEVGVGRVGVEAATGVLEAVLVVLRSAAGDDVEAFSSSSGGRTPSSSLATMMPFFVLEPVGSSLLRSSCNGDEEGSRR